MSTKKRNHWDTLKIIWGYIWPKDRIDLKARVILSLGFMILSRYISVMLPIIYKKIVDAFTINQLILLPVYLILSYGLARILFQFFGELKDVIFARVTRYAQRMMALQTFKHLHYLSLRFHLDRQTGGLSRVIERGMRGTEFLLTYMLFNILPTMLEIIFVTGILIYFYNYMYALVTFTTIAIYIFYTLYITEWRLELRRKMNEKDTEANTKAIDSLLNYETVKYFNNEEHEFERFNDSLKGVEQAAILSQKSLSLLNIGQGAIIGVGLMIMMTSAGKEVLDKTMSIGDFVMINAYLLQLYMPLNVLGFMYREIKQSLVDMDKMFELNEVESDIKDLKDAISLIPKQGHIEFKNVEFGYNSDRIILNNINFEIKPGRTLAIVGPSGSGKSTISRLLYRFFDITKGEILIDGQNIAKVTQSSLRKQIAIVPQDTVLFNDTIFYNILYGKPNATTEEVEHAAKQANIHNFIKTLKDGYNTRVGERGLKLSGGEKQRVAIARAILKNPAILIFDEATSALDSGTEQIIQEEFEKISKNRTTLVIAHRLSTIIDADEIIVLKDGKIAEKGTHIELLQKKGEYALMWEKQQ